MSPSPTVCCWSSPTASSTSCTRSRSVELWGVGPITERKLNDRGIRTVGEVAVLGTGAAGVDPRCRIRASAAGARPTTATRDASTPAAGAVRSDRSRRSVAVRSRPRSIESLLLGIVDRVTRRMRKAGRVGRTVTAAVPLRRLRACHSRPLAGPRHRRNRADRRRRTGRPASRDGHDRRAWADPDRAVGRQPGVASTAIPSSPSSCCCRSVARTGRRSTTPSTRCDDASATLP